MRKILPVILIVILVSPLVLPQSISITSGMRLVECPDYSVTAPVSGETGTTCGMGNDCDLRGSEEVIYEVEIPEDGDWYFSLCGSDFDTYLFVGTTCCGQEVGYRDDFCGLQSQLNAVITAGTYYVSIEAFGTTECGDYLLNIWMEGGCDEFIAVDIFTDEYPNETTWEVIERVSGTVVGSGGPLSDPLTQHHREVCGDPALCYDFYIYDAFGNGICCLNGEGHYEIYDFNGEMVCSGGEFASVDVCPDIGVCVPPEGACCIDGFCVATLEEEECLALGGIWYQGEDCSGEPPFECPLDCTWAIYDNGSPTAYDSYPSQCDPVHPFQIACADDFVIPYAPIEVTGIVAWFSNWGADPPATPADYEEITVTIYSDAGGIPAGNPIDGDPDCAVEGGYVFNRDYLQGEFGRWEEFEGVWRLSFEIWDLILISDITYWLSIEPVMESGLYGQSGAAPGSEQTGSLPKLYAPQLGYNEWETPDTWTSDISFCINGYHLHAHEYIPGDCNCNWIALELDDVITMIATYRGTLENCFTMDCPPHGDNFHPTADPNGNCVANELGDVVTEIAAYRGSDTASGCADCPGSGRLLPGDDDQPILAPSLKSKTRIRKPSGVD